MELWPDAYPKMVGIIADWHLEQSENFMMSLLINRQDDIAKLYIQHYLHEVNDSSLMVFALRNNNETFMKHALKESLFGMQFLSEPTVVAEMLYLLSTRAKTDFILNTMPFANFAQWSQTDCGEFIGYMEEMANFSHFDNRIVLTYNPILTICLACETLTRIGDSIAFFKHDGITINESLLALGNSVVSGMKQSSIKAIFMDEDFKDRAVLNIIVVNGYAELMSDPKVIQLLDELWGGTLTYACDGKLQNFSMLSFVAGAPLKKLPGQSL